MQYRIRRFGVLHTSLIAGAGYGLMGLVVIVPWFLIAMAVGDSAMTGQSNDGSGQFNPFSGFGVAMILVVPLFYAVVGFVMTAVAVLVYNLLASWIGGIELTLEHAE